MKKLLSTLLIVVFLLTSLGLTSFAADDYTVQYLGDGFIRINLTNQSFVEGTTRTFTVNIAEDGEYAMFVGNPNMVSTRFEVKFTKDGKNVTAVNRVRTGTYAYSRLGVQPGGGVVSSFALTAGEWTMSVDATDSTIPYIDIRKVDISVDGSKQAIYPMDVYSAESIPMFHEQINMSTARYAKAPSDYTYNGNLEDSALAKPKTDHGAIIVTNGKTVTFKLNVEKAGEYRIVGYGNFRTNSSNVNKTADETETINMTVGSNPAATGNYTYSKGVAGWSAFVPVETTVNLPVGETNIVFYNPNTDGIKADWYLDYILVEGINIKEGTEIKLTDIRFEDTVSFDYTLNGDKTDATIYAAVYDENMKLIDVKKLPALLGGYGIENASNAKYLKAFVIDSTLSPKSVPATATKN